MRSTIRRVEAIPRISHRHILQASALLVATSKGSHIINTLITDTHLRTCPTSRHLTAGTLIICLPVCSYSTHLTVIVRPYCAGQTVLHKTIVTFFVSIYFQVGVVTYTLSCLHSCIPVPEVGVKAENTPVGITLCTALTPKNFTLIITFYTIA